MWLNYTVQIIIIGVSTTAAILLLIVLGLIMAIFSIKLCGISGQKEVHLPIYEEIPMSGGGVIKSSNPEAIELEINCSYGNIKTIKMIESPAYGRISEIARC